jgi:5-methylthioribose kinase
VSLRDECIRRDPAFPWLDAAAPEAVRRLLAAGGWIAADEPVLACAPAGAGNMNLTLRVTTPGRTLIVKQARPWVERYDHIAAPPERSDYERRFYERVGGIAAVARRMPRLLGADPSARVLVLEDLGAASDCTGMYRGETLDRAELRELATYLRALHDATRGAPDPAFANRGMRALNHAHIFEVPLAPEHDRGLERFEPGLTAAAAALRDDDGYRRRLRATGERYRADGPCLVHGDFFPGSWLRAAAGTRVIDPEFCFHGDAELDVGCAVAHLVLADAAADAVEGFVAAYDGDAPARDAAWTARYAAAEIMRRILGVAQLPIPSTNGRRAALLGRARAAMYEGALTPLLS